MVYIIIFYLIGYVINYSITRNLLRKSTKENYNYNDVSFNLIISLFSWVSVLNNLIIIFFLFMLRKDWSNYGNKKESKPPHWL